MRFTMTASIPRVGRYRPYRKNITAEDLKVPYGIKDLSCTVGWSPAMWGFIGNQQNLNMVM